MTILERVRDANEHVRTGIDVEVYDRIKDNKNHE